MEQSAEEKQEQFGKKHLTESGIAYSAAALFTVVLSLLLSAVGSAAGEGYEKQNWYLYLAYLCAQIAFAGAAALYFIRSKESFKAPFQRCHPKYFLIALLLQFGLLFSLSELNGLFISLLGKAGYHSQGVDVPELAGWNLLPAVLVIGLLPAFFEELLFRGVLARNMRGSGWGLLPVLLLSGAMFSLFHGRPEQTIYQFLCGICFSLVALRAGSILPTVLAHFCNNAVILILAACGVGELSALPMGAYLGLIIPSAVCFVLVLVYLVFFDKRGNGRGKLVYGVEFTVAAGGGLLICAIEWIAALVMGFVHG